MPSLMRLLRQFALLQFVIALDNKILIICSYNRVQIRLTNTYEIVFVISVICFNRLFFEHLESSKSFFNWDSLHARLNSHYEASSYKKKKRKKVKTYRKSVQKEPAVKRCLLILELKPLRSQVKGKYSIGTEFQSQAVQGKNLWT